MQETLRTLYKDMERMLPFIIFRLIAVLRNNVAGNPTSFPQGVNITGFEVHIFGLQKPVCFDLPLIPSKKYALIDIQTDIFEYRLVGKMGEQMISSLTVYNNGSETTYENGDASFGQIYKTSMSDRMTITAVTSPAGIQVVVAPGPSARALGRVGGLLGLSTQIRGMLIQNSTTDNGMATGTIEVSAGPKSTTFRSVLMESLHEQFCWYVSKEDALIFGLNVDDFEIK